MKSAYIFLANGFEEIEALTVVDLLRRAEVNVSMVSVTGKKTVHGAHKIDILADILFEELLGEVDMLILPGGGSGTRTLMAHRELGKLLMNYDKQGKYLAAVCAAPSVYGILGLLQGKKATCYPGWEENLHGAMVIDEKVVEDQNIITSKGPGTSMEFALCLIKKLCGEAKAKQIRNELLY